MTLILLGLSTSKLHPVHKFLDGDDVRVLGVNTLVHGDARPPVHVLGLQLRQGGSPVLLLTRVTRVTSSPARKHVDSTQQTEEQIQRSRFFNMGTNLLNLEARNCYFKARH